MKTICFLLNTGDGQLIYDYWKNNHRQENIVIATPTFERRLIADKLNLPHKSFEKEARSLDKDLLFKNAQRMARYWYEIAGIKDDPVIQAASHYKDYPLLSIILDAPEHLTSNVF